MATKPKADAQQLAQLFETIHQLQEQQEEIEFKLAGARKEFSDYLKQNNLLDGLGITSKGRNPVSTAAPKRPMPSAAEVDPEAPYGRKKDGSPKNKPGRSQVEAAA